MKPPYLTIFIYLSILAFGIITLLWLLAFWGTAIGDTMSLQYLYNLNNMAEAKGK
jgi:hypothetical protein